MPTGKMTKPMVSSVAPCGWPSLQFFCIRATTQVQTTVSSSGSSSGSSPTKSETLNWGLVQNVSVGRRLGVKVRGCAGSPGVQWTLDFRYPGPPSPSLTRVVPAAPRSAAPPPAALIEGDVPVPRGVPGQGIGGEVANLQEGEVAQEVVEGHPVAGRRACPGCPSLHTQPGTARRWGRGAGREPPTLTRTRRPPSCAAAVSGSCCPPRPTLQSCRRQGWRGPGTPPPPGHCHPQALPGPHRHPGLHIGPLLVTPGSVPFNPAPGIEQPQKRLCPAPVGDLVEEERSGPLQGPRPSHGSWGGLWPGLTSTMPVTE